MYRVVTDLAVLDFQHGTARLVSVHPGMDPDEVAANTGFPLDTNDIPVSRRPTDEELMLLDTLDPTGSREREVPS